MTMVMQNSLKSLVLAVVASATVLGFAAAPAEAGEVSEARIQVSRAELAGVEGRKAVQARVYAAAKRVCADGGVNWRIPSETAAYNLCVANAVRDARLQIAAIATKTQTASLN
jgi:UrcA family protein